MFDKLFLLLNMMISLLLGAIFYIPKQVINFQFYAPIRNHLPDMLWSYALLFALVMILDLDIRNWKSKLAVTSISIFWGTLMEFLQLIKVAPGTFDLLDILLEILAVLIAVITIYFYSRRGIYEENKNTSSRSLLGCFWRSRNC